MRWTNVSLSGFAVSAGVRIVSLLGFIGLTTISCSQMSRPNTANRASVKDVPQRARQEGEGIRSRVIVLPFLNDQGVSGPREVEARVEFLRVLQRRSSLIFVSPIDLGLDLVGLASKDGYRFDDLIKSAAGLGVAILIEGRVLEVKTERKGQSLGVVRELKAEVTAKVQLKAVATQTGRELINETQESTVDSSERRILQRKAETPSMAPDSGLMGQAVDLAFSQMIPDLFRSFDLLSWQGRVAMVSGERVFLNAGRLSGLQIGDLLKVSEEGDEVFDPETGRFIGRAPGRMKGTIEIISYFGQDGAIALLHSGSGIKENDIVEMY